MERFGKDGKLIIPLAQRKKGTKELDEQKIRYVATEAYCPKGCSIIDRENEELQKIYALYLSEKLLPWQKKFPDRFYKELFRLNNWDFTVNGIKKRPSVIGIWTNKLIYEQLPKNILTELKNRTPRSENGNYMNRFFQRLEPLDALFMYPDITCCDNNIRVCLWGLQRPKF